MSCSATTSPDASSVVVATPSTTSPGVALVEPGDVLEEPRDRRRRPRAARGVGVGHAARGRCCRPGDRRDARPVLAIHPHLISRLAQRLAQVGHGGMIRRELIEAQDQIEGGGEVCELVAEVGVHTAMQQRRQRSRLLPVQQQREHALLLRLGAEKTIVDQIDLCRHDVAGAGVLVLVLPAVERRADHDDPVALLDPLHESRHARADLRVVPPVQAPRRSRPFADPSRAVSRPSAHARARPRHS